MKVYLLDAQMASVTLKKKKTSTMQICKVHQILCVGTFSEVVVLYAITWLKDVKRLLKKKKKK